MVRSARVRLLAGFLMSTLRVPELNAKLLADASRASDLAEQLSRLARSAAHAASSPITVMYLKDKAGFAAVSWFGLEGDIDNRAAEPLVSEAADKHIDNLLVINDRNDERGLFPRGNRLFGASHPEIRFAAAMPIANARGDIFGVMVVADMAPRAGLSGATTYVLRTLASQICTVLELEAWRKSDGGSPAAHHSKMERLRLLESVVVNANDSVLITEAEPVSLPGPRIVYCNAAFTRTTGYSEKEVLGKTPRILQSVRTDKMALARLRAALVAWKPVEVELLNTTKDGVDFWVELSIAPVADERGWFTHWISVQRDVSDRKTVEEATVRARLAEAANEALGIEIQERKRVENQLSYAAFHDDLTKLRNRPFFMERLGETLRRTQDSPRTRCAVLFIDLDRFKMVNDSLGHRAGDLLLMEVSRRMESCLRPTDILARIGGDEFAVLIEGEQDADRATDVARRIIAVMRQPMWIGNQEVFSSCTIGVVQATETYFTPEQLLRDADIAMYEAKRNDKGGVAVFAGSMHDGAMEALKLQTDLQNALTRKEFQLDYQPICHAGTTDVVGLEALIRWRHPVRGVVSPLEFIGAAEQTGLIGDIGRWVVMEACQQVQAWRARYPGLKLRLNINCSGRELEDLRFIPHLQEVLAVTELDPKAVELEVTEAIFLRHPEQMQQVLGIIRALGVRVALDDFGTGYSSLGYLDRYEIDTLKIDQTFVRNMLDRPRTMAIVQNIVSLAHALQLDIVAEGVEDENQLRILAAMGCTTVQGYYLSRPMSVTAVDTMLANQHAGTTGDCKIPKFVGLSDDGRLVADRVA
jgi:diguanylate cyclase (GGDEF)-like protein/PAS domain S-box-containing protein